MKAENREKHGMFEYNRAVRKSSSRCKMTPIGTRSLYDETGSVGSAATKSSGGKSCWRCKAQIDSSWSYCIVCGNAVNLDVNSNTIRPISPIVNGIIQLPTHSTYLSDLYFSF